MHILTSQAICSPFSIFVVSEYLVIEVQSQSSGMRSCESGRKFSFSNFEHRTSFNIRQAFKYNIKKIIFKHFSIQTLLLCTVVQSRGA